jgi:hypothetical protein
MIYTATQSFYNEINHYDFVNHRSTIAHTIYHFTQLVWKDTKQIGFGIALSRRNGMKCVYVCVNYWPRGNWQGEFDKNVFRPRSSSWLIHEKNYFNLVLILFTVYIIGLY